MIKDDKSSKTPNKNFTVDRYRVLSKTSCALGKRIVSDRPKRKKISSLCVNNNIFGYSPSIFRTRATRIPASCGTATRVVVPFLRRRCLRTQRTSRRWTRSR
uniref:Uncharacterized protein n=1 Tax=Sipha flava TaxID=143950 RepID=A0A2S2QLN3_9HEMI